MSDTPECDCPPLTQEGFPIGGTRNHRPDCPAVAWLNDTHSAETIQRAGGFRLSPGEEAARRALDAVQALTERLAQLQRTVDLLGNALAERVGRLEQNLVGLSDVIVTLSEAVDQLAKYITEETGA